MAKPDDTKGPAAKQVKSLKPGEKPDQLKNSEKSKAENRQEALIDEALEESFPASDPPAPKKIT
ncbi:MAG: hypothetical protein J0L52_06235 [Caulobacterales bacterium]|nr:hypothetical protein [Caulobacterales bacterium]